VLMYFNVSAAGEKPLFDSMPVLAIVKSIR
jgi:hypothetical protein